MWDVLTWHDGTLAIAWWAVIVLVVALLSIGGTAAARRTLSRLRDARRARGPFRDGQRERAVLGGSFPNTGPGVVSGYLATSAATIFPPATLRPDRLRNSACASRYRLFDCLIIDACSRLCIQLPSPVALS